VRFLADPAAEFTKALELDFDAPAIFGGPRGKRYALVIRDGKVASVHVEPDNIGTSGESGWGYSVLLGGRDSGQARVLLVGRAADDWLAGGQSRWPRTCSARGHPRGGLG
jgi:hypothetical protein